MPEKVLSPQRVIEVLTGPMGLSAFQVAKQNGFPGNVSEWLESLRGNGGLGDVTLFIGNFLKAENGPEARTVLGLGTAAQQSTDYLRNRSNQLGQQEQDTIIGLSAALASLAPKSNPTFTGTVSVPTQATDNNSPAAASTAFVQFIRAGLNQLIAAKADASTVLALNGSGTQTSARATDFTGGLKKGGVDVATINDITSGGQDKGVWNASTNSPALTSTSPAGVIQRYTVSTEGTSSAPTGSSVTYKTGDILFSTNGGPWSRVPFVVANGALSIPTVGGLQTALDQKLATSAFPTTAVTPTGGGTALTLPDALQKLGGKYDAGTPLGLLAGLKPFTILTAIGDLKDGISMRDWNGLDLGGGNDNASILNGALAQADTGSGRRCVIAPAGVIDLGSTVTLSAAQGIRGEKPSFPSLGTGTVFRLAHANKGFVVNGQYGVTFERFATMRDQPSPNGSTFEPYNYDWDFYLDTADIHMDRVHLINPTRGIVSATGGRHRLMNITGHPLLQAYECISTLDSNTLFNWHIWPFWAPTDAVYRYTLGNRIDFTSYRNDNSYWGNIFSICSYLGIRILNHPNGGTTNKLKIVGADIDVCAFSLLSESTNATFSLQNYSTQGHIGEIAGGVIGNAGLIRILGNNNHVNMDDVRVAFAAYYGIFIGDSNHARIGATEFSDWDRAARAGFPAIEKAGSTGSAFLSVPPDIRVAPSSGPANVKNAAVRQALYEP